MLKVIRHSLLFIAIVFSIYYYAINLEKDEDLYPTRPIQVVVPFSPGGSTDTFARIIQRSIREHQLMPVPLVIVNKPGGATTVGSTYVRNSRADGYTLLCLHEAIMTTKLTSQSPHGPEAFEPVAATGEMGHFIVASEDGPFPSMRALMIAASEDSSPVRFGVNLSMPSHFTGMALEKSHPGARFRFVSTGGGANRLASLMGGHLDAAIFTVSEYIRFKESGLKALVYLGAQRHAAAPDVPTSIELGYPVTDINFQYWWFPGGTDSAKVEYFADVLQQAMATESVQQRLRELHIAPEIMRGEALAERIDERTEDFAAMELPRHTKLPNVAWWTVGAVLFFGVITVADTIKRGKEITDKRAASGRRFDLAAAGIFCVVIYALLMGTDVLSFVWATMLFVFACGLLLTGGNREKLVSVVELALILSFGLHFVFTEVFSVMLP